MKYRIVGEILQYSNILDIVPEIESRAGADPENSQGLMKRTLGENFERITSDTWAMPCPFGPHEKPKHPFSYKAPKLFLSNSSQSYFCPECNRSGDVLSFVMDYFKIEMIEAVRKIIGYDLSLKARVEGLEELVGDMRTVEVLEEALRYFKASVPAVEKYLKQRGYTESSIAEFQIGYAPMPARYEVSGIMRHLLDAGFSIPEIGRQGLIKPKPVARLHSLRPLDYYETLSGRIIFPIYTASGEIAGFAGRINPDVESGEFQSAKFLNLPDDTSFGTPRYRKGRLLYGLERVMRMRPRPQEVYLMEGYMDVDISQIHGIPAIGNGGTALTEENASLIAKMFDTVYIVNDMDKAGINATKKAFEVLFGTRTRSVALVLPGTPIPDSKNPTLTAKNDPADFFVKHGHTKQDFLDLDSLGLYEFYSRFSKTQTPEDKLRLLEELSFTLDRASNYAKRSIYYEELSELIGMNPAAIAIKSFEILSSIQAKRSAETELQLSRRTYNVANFLAHLLTSNSASYAAAYIRDVPPSIIPDDGSIFPQHLKELYVYITKKLHNHGDSELLLFEAEDEIDLDSLMTDRPKVSSKKNAALELDYDLERRINGYKTLKYLVDDGTLKEYPYEVISLLRDKLPFNLAHFAKIVRMYIFEDQQRVIMSDAIHALASGDEKAVQEAISNMEKLHNSI